MKDAKIFGELQEELLEVRVEEKKERIRQAGFCAKIMTN